MDAPAIEFRGVSKRYGSQAALDAISMRVERGEIFGYLGPNGAGKTTSIRVLFDLIRPNGGSASVLGFDCQHDGVEARRRMSYLPGELSLYSTLTGRQVIDFFASLRPDGVDPAYVAGVLDRLDLDPGRRVGDYSRGNRQKLGIVLAVMARPEVLVLDEPTSGLDPLVHDEVTGILRDLANAGSAVFFSSHVLSEVERMCHRVGFIRQGRIVAVEEVGALKGRSLHIVEVTFSGQVPIDAFSIPGVHELRRDGEVVHLEVSANLDAVLKAIARYSVVDLRTEQPSLEDVFLAYYESPSGAGKTVGDLVS